MAFKLIIEFHGLCLFVPDEQRQVMHVLLPEATGIHAAHMPVHDASFHFARRHNAHAGSTRIREHFTGKRCTFGDGATGGINLSLPPEVLDVSGVLKVAGIKPNQVQAGNQVNVKSHVVLTAGSYQCHGDVGGFEIDGQPVRATSVIRWAMDFPDDTPLQWKFDDLNGNPHSTPMALVPSRRKIRLFMMHAPEGGNALPICDENQHNHFPMYYPLFDASGPAVHCTGDYEDGNCKNASPAFPPTDVSAHAEAVAEAIEAADAFRESGAHAFAPNVFTCMLGQTRVDPNS